MQACCTQHPPSGLMLARLDSAREFSEFVDARRQRKVGRSNERALSSPLLLPPALALPGSVLYSNIHAEFQCFPHAHLNYVDDNAQRDYTLK